MFGLFKKNKVELKKLRKPNRYGVYICPLDKHDGKSVTKVGDRGVSGRYCKNNCEHYYNCKRWR